MAVRLSDGVLLVVKPTTVKVVAPATGSGTDDGDNPGSRVLGDSGEEKESREGVAYW
jgi:hypothetical protein